MIVTTARKPSSKTRIFCKHLSRFTGWEYITRGKTSLSEIPDGSFLVIGESRGNPSSFSFFSGGRCVLYIRANVSLDTEIGPGSVPAIAGDSPLAISLGKITGLKICGTSERVININGRIEFIYNGIPYIILKILKVRGEGIV